MDQELKAKWVAALRAGEYQQGVGRLHDETCNTYCCLGVLMKVAGKRPQFPTTLSLKEELDLGIASEMTTKLENMNDGENGHEKHSFALIADYIEANL